MELSKYIKSQSGAALILVLFAVLFITIVGNVLLNTTTYSLQSIEKNEKNQQEFYMLEGAIDLMIYTMDNYKLHTGNYLIYDDGKFVLDEYNNRIEIIVSGPFYYIDKSQSTMQEFSINGKDIVVSIEDIHPTVPYIGNQKKYEYKLVSKYKDNPKLIREVYLTTVVENKTEIISTSPGGGTDTPGFPGNETDRIIYTSSAQIHHHLDAWGNITSKAGVTFDRFIKYYKLDPSLIPDNGKSYEDGKVRYINTIKESGNDTNFNIPKSYLTYAKSVKISGCGNSGKITIDGVLIAESVEITGNCPYILNGGIITEKLTVNVNKHAPLTVSGNGFDEDGSAGGYVPNPPIYGSVTPADRYWNSTITEITNTETKR